MLSLTYVMISMSIADMSNGEYGTEVFDEEGASEMVNRGE